MTPTQRQVVDTLKARIERMRESGQPDTAIKAGLEVTEGWPVAAVAKAFEEVG